MCFALKWSVLFATEKTEKKHLKKNIFYAFKFILYLFSYFRTLTVYIAGQPSD